MEAVTKAVSASGGKSLLTAATGITNYPPLGLLSDPVAPVSLNSPANSSQAAEAALS